MAVSTSLTLTSANASLALSVANLYAQPVILAGFSTDMIYNSDPMVSAEVLMGVDGVLSAGFVYNPFRFNIELQADSESNQVFDDWWSNSQQNKQAYVGTLTIILPSVKKQALLNRGFLISFPGLPDAARILRPRRFGMVWTPPVLSPYSPT